MWDEYHPACPVASHSLAPTRLPHSESKVFDPKESYARKRIGPLTSP